MCIFIFSFNMFTDLLLMYNQMNTFKFYNLIEHTLYLYKMMNTHTAPQFFLWLLSLPVIDFPRQWLNEIFKQ